MLYLKIIFESSTFTNILELNVIVKRGEDVTVQNPFNATLYWMKILEQIKCVSSYAVTDSGNNKTYWKPRFDVEA